MKDTRHHLKYLQRKVLKSAKNTNTEMKELTKPGKVVPFKRPKTVLNKRKIA